MKYDVQECIDTINPIGQDHLKGSTTAYLNAVFEPQEQVSPAQMDLLGAAFMLATGGPAQTHVGTVAGSSHSDLPWDGKKNSGRKR